MKKGLLYLISAMIFSISCSSRDPGGGPQFSTKLLKQNSVVVDNGEHTYVVECKDQRILWGYEYRWTVNEETFFRPFIEETLFYEEEWFNLIIPENKKNITIHVHPNNKGFERKINIRVMSLDTISQFTLVQKK